MNIYSETMSCMALEWTFSVINSWEVYIVMQLYKWHNLSDLKLYPRNLTSGFSFTVFLTWQAWPWSECSFPDMT